MIKKTTKCVDLRFQEGMEAEGWETVGYEIFGYNGIPQFAIMIKEEKIKEDEQ